MQICRATAELAPSGMLLHSGQVPRGEAESQPSTEAQEQAETLAEDIMGIDESEGDLPLPLYLAGESLAMMREVRAHTRTLQAHGCRKVADSWAHGRDPQVCAALWPGHTGVRGRDCPVDSAAQRWRVVQQTFH